MCSSASRPRWPIAGTAPVLCGVLQVVAASILAAKTQLVVTAALPHLDPARSGIPPATLSALTTIAGYPIAFGLSAMALICLDVLFVDSRRGSRLAECAGLGFYAYVPASILLIVAAWHWSPEPMVLDPTASLLVLQQTARRYQEAVQATPLFAIADSVATLSLIWFVALLGAAFKAVTGATTRAAVLVTALLWLVFGGVPLLARAWLT